MASQAPPDRGAGSSVAPPQRNRLSREEFARLFVQTSRALWCIAAAQAGRREGAEDAVQQAAVVALQRLDEFDPSTSFLAWMGKIVRLTCMNEVHKEQRRRTAPTDPGTIDTSTRSGSAAPERVPVGKGGEVRVDQESFDDRTLTALRTLDPVARSCLLLRVCLNVPYKELALALDIPPGTAMSHVDRARKALREQLATPSDRSASPTERTART